MTLQEIEEAITGLTQQEFVELRDWLAEFEAEVWDRQIEEDAASGRLESIMKRSIEECREGRYSETESWTS